MNDQLDLFTFSQEEKKEPEIIRCRHCKYYVPNYQPPKGLMYDMCAKVAGGMISASWDGYCSDARRKE